MFLFRLLTTAQPWGMAWNDPDTKLSESMKYEPRSQLLGTTHYDYQVELDLRPFDHTGAWRPDPKTAWPLRAGLPVPFDALVALCGGPMEPFVLPEWEVIEQLIHPLSKGLPSQEKGRVPAHLDSLLNALEAVLHGTNTRRPTVATLLRLDPQEDPFLNRQASIEAVDAAQMPDAIEVLFRRTNAGGTPLAGEEMAYSLLKAR
jgi:hypothetical protein